MPCSTSDESVSSASPSKKPVAVDSRPRRRWQSRLELQGLRPHRAGLCIWRRDAAGKLASGPGSLGSRIRLAAGSARGESSLPGLVKRCWNGVVRAQSVGERCEEPLRVCLSPRRGNGYLRPATRWERASGATPSGGGCQRMRLRDGSSPPRLIRFGWNNDIAGGP